MHPLARIAIPNTDTIPKSCRFRIKLPPDKKLCLKVMFERQPDLHLTLLHRSWSTYIWLSWFHPTLPDLLHVRYDQLHLVLVLAIFSHITNGNIIYITKEDISCNIRFSDRVPNAMMKTTATPAAMPNFVANNIFSYLQP